MDLSLDCCSLSPDCEQGPNCGYCSAKTDKGQSPSSYRHVIHEESPLRREAITQLSTAQGKASPDTPQNQIESEPAIGRGITVSKPTFKQILDVLKRQVLVGKSYLDIAKGLLEADPVIRDTAPTFFGLTIEGSLELAQMTIARLYDDATRGSVTIRRMLVRATEEAASFQRGDVRTEIAKREAAIIALEPVLESIRHRRNEWLAHLDPRTVANPASLSAKAKLSIPDLDRAFKETEIILLRLSSLYEGVIGELQFLGGDDYKVAFDWIRSAKCTFIENYEKEFHVSWTGPRPKNCSGNLLHMI